MFSNTRYFIHYRMTLGSKENYINAAATRREMSFHRRQPEERLA
jgi:hypothetical protein